MSPGRTDPEVARRHLLALERAVEQLKRHRGKPLAELRANPDTLWAVERGLQLCAQNLLDLATHIVASSGRDVSDYASAIDELADLGALPKDFARQIRGIAGFRNVLVHAYLEVDPARVHEVLNRHLDDFSTFAAHVRRYFGRPVV